MMGNHETKKINETEERRKHKCWGREDYDLTISKRAFL